MKYTLHTSEKEIIRKHFYENRKLTEINKIVSYSAQYKKKIAVDCLKYSMKLKNGAIKKDIYKTCNKQENKKNITLETISKKLSVNERTVRNWIYCEAKGKRNCVKSKLKHIVGIKYQNKITNKNISEKTGVNKSTVNRWINGKSRPYAKNFSKFVSVLKSEVYNK